MLTMIEHTEIVLKAPPDSTNNDLANNSRDGSDNDSVCALHSSHSVSTSPSVSKTRSFRDPYLPEDDGSILTPEHAFVQYQTRSEDQSCQICGQPAVGFHHRAYVCEACKKFFMRHTAARFRQSESGGGNPLDAICPMGGQCRVEGPGRGKCPHCRYRKCLDLGMTLTPPGGESGCDISQIPCRVCGGPSSGFHFGALTCEGCKGFFRRTVLSNVRLECLSNNDCPITPANRNMCKSCRFRRCLAVGMSKSGSRIGRQPNAIKYYCAREISQLAGSTHDLDSTQLSCAASSVSSSRSAGPDAARHSVSTIPSVGEKCSSPAATFTPSWAASGSMDRSVQPAQSSSDPSSGFTHLYGRNGQFSTLSRTSSKSAHLGNTDSVRLQASSFAQSSVRCSSLDPDLYPPDNGPESVSSKKRRPADHCTGSHTDESTMDTISPHCDSDGGRNKYSPSSCLSFGEPDSQNRGLNNCPGPRGWTTVGNSQDRNGRPHNTPTHSVSHRSTPLEYSLPNPDITNQISSTTPIHDRRSSVSSGSAEDILINSSGQLLAPLSLYLPMDESCPENARFQFKLFSCSGDAVQQRKEPPSSTYAFYPTSVKEQATLHHFRQPCRTQLDPDASPRQLSPMPSTVLSASPVPQGPGPGFNDTDFILSDTASPSRTTRSIVDQLTSTVLQFRNHQQQQRMMNSVLTADLTCDSSLSSTDAPDPSCAVMRATCSSPPEIRQPRGQPFSRSHRSSLHSDTMSLSSTPPARTPTQSGLSSYPISPSCKSTSPELSWDAKTQQHLYQQQQRFIKSNNRCSSNESNFLSSVNKYDLISMNGNNSSTVDPNICQVVGSPSTSSASWFAAAAAAAAVANALMAATQTAPNQNPTPGGCGDVYTVLSKSRGHERLSSRDNDLQCSSSERFRIVHSTNSSLTKRSKVGSSDAVHDSPATTIGQGLGTMYGLKLGRCTAPSGSAVLRSLNLPTSGVDLLPSSSAPNLAAAAVAAAAAAATAAGIVLSGSRVCTRIPPEDFSHLRRSPDAVFPSYSDSPITSSPSPPCSSNSQTHPTTTDSLCVDRTGHLFPSYLPGTCDAIRRPLGSVEPTPSVNLHVTCKEVNARIRPRNGMRATFVSLQAFADGINVAAKYMISERKKIRNNLPQTCRPMHLLVRVEEVWDRMMQHFELHSKFIVHFVKLIPGFNQLELGDKRQLVRGAMYPLMLLELSRDYVNSDGSQYNYFDFTESEREVILKHFPTFHTITGHLIRSGKFLDQVGLDNIELTLVCAQEVFKNYQGLLDPQATEHLYHLAGRVLTDHIVGSGQPLEERSTLLRRLSPLLEQWNMEHHEVIAQLRQDKPQLDFPELYTEMFQLTEAEEREQIMTGLRSSEGNS
ncbi:unnamed protein product [Dicrocoelium dendriticum]|nr:unnamed protein product [Dicrocoelium dendriticum]